MPDFLSRAKKGVRAGMKVAGVKSREMVDVRKIAGRKRRLEKERRAALEDLGALVCEMTEKNSFDESLLRSKSVAIAGLGSRIKDYEQQIEGVHERAKESLKKGKTERTG